MIIRSLCVATALLSASAAHADFQVRVPTIEFREFEIEHNGSIGFDRKSSLNRDQSYTTSLGLGVTPFWKVELEGEFAAPPGQRLTTSAATIENTFQLTEEGEYWADLGFFAEYSQATRRHTANTFTFGPLIQKQTLGLGGVPLLHTLNLLFEKEVGPTATGRTGFLPAWQTRTLLNPYFQPGVEIYARIDDLGHTGKLNDQQYFAGPMFAGAVSLAPYGKVKYELGYLVGLTSNTPRSTVRWKLEYEIAF